MKKLIYIIVVVLFSSCGDFLEESSQDLIIHKTVKDYSEFCLGRGISEIIRRFIRIWIL